MRRRVRVIGWLSAAPLAVLCGAIMAQPAKPAVRKPQVWAVVVGVGNYTDPLVADNPTAAGDAGAVRDWFLRKAGWSVDHVLFFSDLGGRSPGTVDAPRANIRPSRDNLVWAFRSWLPARVKAGDLVLFYYSGRVGTAASLQDPLGGTRAEYYLLPTEASRANVAATGWPLDREVDRFVRETSGRCPVVCWLATTVREKPPAAHRPDAPGDPHGPVNPTGRDWLSRLVRWPNVTAWLADDRPLENPARDETSAAFTRAVLDGMSGPAGKQNLAACLLGMRRNPAHVLRGFQAMGGVPPQLTLWSDQFGEPFAPPRPEVVLQAGHDGRVTEIVSSADGEHVMTAGADSTVRVWSLKERALLRVLTGHQVGANALGLVGGDRWLVSGGGRPASGVLIHDLKDDARRVVPDQPHDAPLARVVVLPDGAHCVSVDTHARAFVWDLRATPPAPRPWPEREGKALGPVNCLDVAVGGGPDRGKVAALGDDRSVRVLDASGGGEPVVIRWPDQPGAVAVDPQGVRLAVGFDNGRVVVRDTEGGGDEVVRKVAPGPITRLAFSPLGLLAVGHDEGLAVWMPPAKGAAQPGPAFPVLSDGPIGPLAFSNDGRLLAAGGRNTGGLSVWRLDPEGPNRTVHDAAAGVSALAFTADSRVLVAGGLAGGVTTRPADEAAPAAPSWSVPCAPGQGPPARASPTRRYLLILNERNRALVWDLKERSCRRLPGAWTSGAFGASDDRLVMTAEAGPGRPGRLVSVRIGDGTVTAEPAFFRGPGDGVPEFETTGFEGVTLSPGGERVAATAGPGQPPLVCVWDAKTGRLTHWLRPDALVDPVACMSFSTDGRHLLTAGDSPAARLWDLNAREGDLKEPAVTFRDTGPSPRNVSAAAIRPGARHQVVTGHRDGVVRLWAWREGEPEPAGRPLDLVLGLFAGEVKALTFTDVGPDPYLAASGDGTSLWLARMSDPRPVPVTDLGERPHHFEQVGALIAMPRVADGPSMLVSGSDDTTVKLWEVRDRALRLRGTFASAPGRDDDGPGDPDRAEETDWVVSTPDGRFDASAHGRELVRFRHSDKARAMEQLDDTRLYTFDLGERLLASAPLEGGLGPGEPPPIAIEPPPRVDPGRAEIGLTMTLGSEDLRDVRLYHNTVPIRIGLESEGQGEPRGRITVPVRLVKGSNRFYAMASTVPVGAAFDGRSPEVEVDFDGPADPGRLHVIALGVGDYKKRRLKYPEHDAQQLSTVLHGRASVPGGPPTGSRFVRTNADVTTAGVNKAFRDLAVAVKGRPQDKVVVFLAGHTGVFEGDQFCLLLPTFPFPDQAPAQAQVRGGIGERGAGEAATKVDPRHLLPYALIESNLMRLDALNRLVIVDACQADSIHDDPQVKDIRKWMEIRSRRARTSYLMAARRGEPAVEVDDLRHGLFTYVLLCGLGGETIDRARVPREVARVGLRGDADFDNDGVVTTGELDDYGHRFLPPLAGLFPQFITRNLEEAARRRPEAPPVPPVALDQGLHVQGVNTSFPLVPLVRGPNGP